MTSLFPLIKRFKDVKDHKTFLTEDTIIHTKCFRKGSVFNILGWRDVKGKPFLVIQKGSWNGLVDYEKFLLISESIKI